MDASGTYRRFAEFYDAYAGGFAGDIPLYRHITSGRPSVLEIGCGTGRVLGELAGPSRNMVGVDISAEMLALAGSKLEKEIARGLIRIFRHDFSERPLEGRFDAALVTWYTFNYVVESPVAFLNNVASSLRQGAPVALDLFYPRPFAQPEIEGVWTAREITVNGAPCTLRDRRTMRGNLEERTQVYETGGAGHRIVTRRRFYPKTEIRSLLERAGFTEIAFVENYDITTKHAALENEATNGDFVCIGVNTRS